jgi:hypothetical protein
MIELLAVSHQSNNREIGGGLSISPSFHIERARYKNLAFFIAHKQSYVKIVLVLFRKVWSD